jgi:predicted nucleic acid-binding protein
LLIEQQQSERVDRWFAEDAQLALWTLTPVEITSALWRLVREGLLNDEIALMAEARSHELMGAAHVVVDIEMSAALAQRLLRVHALRAGDALQLGAALVWSNGRPEGRILHTLDERLAWAARREGFEIG